MAKVSGPAAILDIDGTLVDSNYQHTIAWYRALRQHDQHVAVWRIHRHVGMGGDQMIAALCGDEVEEGLGEDIRAAEKALYMAMIDEVEQFGPTRRPRADHRSQAPGAQRGPGQLGQARRDRALPGPARRARSRRRVDELRRRRGDQARARSRGGRAGARRRRPGGDDRRFHVGLPRGRQRRASRRSPCSRAASPSRSCARRARSPCSSRSTSCAGG